MFGNGVRIGMGLTLQDPLQIQPAPQAARAGWDAAAAGSISPGYVGQQIGASKRPATGATAWASASSAGPEVQSKLVKYVVYLLKSEKDGLYYIGYSS